MFAARVPAVADCPISVTSESIRSDRMLVDHMVVLYLASFERARERS
jgi:hypothetical protein